MENDGAIMTANLKICIVSRKENDNKEAKKMKNVSSKTVGMVQVALLAALIIIMANTPLGYIPLGFMNATTIHIPVILGAILLGPKNGALLGFIFGLSSFIKSIITPNITSFVFNPFYSVGEFHGGFGSIIICFLPRILVGVVAYFVYKALYAVLKNKKSGQLISLGVAGVAGSFTNTALVMGLILVFFRDSYAAALGKSASAIYGAVAAIVVTNGIPEAIVAAIIVAFVGKILIRFIKA